MSITDDFHVVHVHVENASEVANGNSQKTREVQPQHFTTSTFLLPALGNAPANVDTNLNQPVEILQLDPLRRRAIISFNGSGQVILAHSQAQAQSLQTNVTQAADEGALFTCPTAIRIEGTGPLWAVAAFGVVNPPAGGPSTALSVTGTANAATTLTVPAAGIFTDILTSLSGSFSAASLNATTLTVTSGAQTLFSEALPSGVTNFTVPLPAGGLLGAGASTIVATLSAGGAAITSTLNAGYQQQSGQSVQVGVLQERLDPAHA